MRQLASSLHGWPEVVPQEKEASGWSHGITAGAGGEAAVVCEVPCVEAEDGKARTRGADMFPTPTHKLHQRPEPWKTLRRQISPLEDNTTPQQYTAIDVFPQPADSARSF